MSSVSKFNSVVIWCFEWLLCLHLQGSSRPSLEDEATVIFETLGTISSNNTVLHPRQPEFSATPLWEPQILHSVCLYK